MCRRVCACTVLQLTDQLPLLVTPTGEEERQGAEYDETKRLNAMYPWANASPRRDRHGDVHRTP